MSTGTPTGQPRTDPARTDQPLTDQSLTDQSLVEHLARESFGFDGTGRDPERNCWLAVHRHIHGVLPSEYDIRDVPEDLYLEVLARRRSLSA